MICPYCSVEMEPIDLSGKIFCSNCGMTIGNDQNSTPKEIPHISHMQTDSDITEITETPSASNNTPVVEEVKPVVQDESQKVRAELMKMMSPEKPLEPFQTENQPIEMAPTPNVVTPTETTPVQKVPSGVSSGVVEEPKIADMVEEATPVPTEPIQKVEINTTNVPKSKVESDTLTIKTPVKSNVTKSITDQKKVEHPTNEEKPHVDLPQEKPSEAFTSKVKEIDTLGASGVLLDILDDSAIEKEREQKTQALKAAEDLIDDLRFDAEKETTQPDKATEKPTKVAKETKDIKEIEKQKNADQTLPAATIPVFSPEEIEAALTGKELPKEKDKTGDSGSFKPSEEDIKEALVQTTAEDLHKDQTYNQKVDEDNSNNIKSTAVKSYFTNIFKKV